MLKSMINPDLTCPVKSLFSISPGSGKARRILSKVIILVLGISLFFSSIVYSTPVNVETAKQVARNWYSERIDEGSNKFEIVETIIEEENSENIFYIFNFSKIGFVMVSADDIVVPILGYSFEQNYELKNHPPQFDAMLVCFKDQIVYAKENVLSATREISDEWERLEVKTENFEKIRDIKNVSPLITVNWNQGWDWNAYCPEDAAGPGGHAYAGCTAVATAQVMKYWSHPSTGTGTHGYNHPTYGYLYADFGVTTYDWASMPNTTASHDTKTLLYHIGVGVEMDYGPSGSGAWVGEYCPSALTALKNYFKYDLSAYFALKNSYANSTWESMVRNELDNARPLIYRGYGDVYGHAFNLDGYQGTNYFHFNWGWSGAYNGYYYLTNLNPGSSNFTNDQGGIFYLFPITGSIEGTVTLNGGAGNLEEVEITAGGITVNPDDVNGDYTINITSGTYDVTASLDGYRDSTIVGVEVLSGQSTNGIDFTLEVYNGPPDWEPISGTQCHMVLMAEIILEGEEFESNGDNMAGAFCWTDSLECRGIAMWESGGAGFWYFDIVSNVNSGEEISFKIYDSYTDMIYACNETIVFENNTTIGTPFDPYQLTSTTPPVVEITIDGDDVVLSWSPVSGATDYKVYLSDDPYTGFTELATNGGATTYTHINGATATKCFYRVTALNGGLATMTK